MTPRRLLIVSAVLAAGYAAWRIVSRERDDGGCPVCQR